MRITQLTVLGFEINRAIDSGEHSNVSIKTIYKEIKKRTIFDYLKVTLKRDIFGDLSAVDKEELLNHWESLSNVASSGELLVEHNGLNLLLAYILEGIQQGTSRDGKLPTQTRI